MKFLVDENISKSIISFLKENGYDLLIVREELTGRNDEDLMKIAYKENRIIITNDKDFGYLYYKLDIPSHGIILFRFNDEDPVKKVSAFNKVLKNFRNKIKNHFIIISENKIRIRKLKK